MGPILIILLGLLWVVLGFFCFGFCHQFFDNRSDVDEEDLRGIAFTTLFAPIVAFIGLFVGLCVWLWKGLLGPIVDLGAKLAKKVQE